MIHFRKKNQKKNLIFISISHFYTLCWYIKLITTYTTCLQWVVEPRKRPENFKGIISERINQGLRIVHSNYDKSAGIL